MLHDNCETEMAPPLPGQAASLANLAPFRASTETNGGTTFWLVLFLTGSESCPTKRPYKSEKTNTEMEMLTPFFSYKLRLGHMQHGQCNYAQAGMLIQFRKVFAGTTNFQEIPCCRSEVYSYFPQEGRHQRLNNFCMQIE